MLPDVESLGAPEEHQGPGDLALRINCKGQSALLLVTMKGGKVYPKTALRAVEPLFGKDGLPMLVAPSLSETTRALLREKGINYWDQGGSLYLNLPHGIFWFDKPPPPQPREARTLKNPFKGSASQVLHALLLEPDRLWKVTELAKVAQVSAYTSQLVIDYLEKQLWVEKEGRGPRSVRRITQPGKLLDEWAANYTVDDYDEIKLHRLARTPEIQLEQLREFLGDEPWALTLEHGAATMAPFLTRLPTALTAIVSDSQHWASLAKEAGYREVSDGENLLLRVASNKTPLLGRQNKDGLQVASPIQLYLDLYQWPRRGKEQATHLREKVLSF